MTVDDLADRLHEHALEDSERHGEVMGAIGRLSEKVDGLGQSLRTAEARQWEEHPSRVGATPAGGGPLGTKAIAGLIVAIVALTETLAYAVKAALH